MNKDVLQQYKVLIQELIQQLKKHPNNVEIKRKLKHIRRQLRIVVGDFTTIELLNINAQAIPFPANALGAYNAQLQEHPFAQVQFTINSGYVPSVGGRSQAIANGYNVDISLSNNALFINDDYSSGQDIYGNDYYLFKVTNFNLNWDKTLVLPDSWTTWINGYHSNLPPFKLSKQIKVKNARKGNLRFTVILNSGLYAPFTAYNMGFTSESFTSTNENNHTPTSITLAPFTMYIKVTSSFSEGDHLITTLYSVDLPTRIPLK
jgi:hypothetical protein